MCTLQPDVIGSLVSLEELRLDCNDLLHLPPVSTARLSELLFVLLFKMSFLEWTVARHCMGTLHWMTEDGSTES